MASYIMRALTTGLTTGIIIFREPIVCTLIILSKHTIMYVGITQLEPIVIKGSIIVQNLVSQSAIKANNLTGAQTFSENHLLFL